VAGGSESVLIVDEWHVTGEPGTIAIAGRRDPDNPRFPSYHFVYRSNDARWCGTEARGRAQEFVERCLNETDPAKRWEDGPRLFHRTVTYSALEPVPLKQETPDRE
jgi:hypothetical protein